MSQRKYTVRMVTQNEFFLQPKSLDFENDINQVIREISWFSPQ